MSVFVTVLLYAILEGAAGSSGVGAASASAGRGASSGHREGVHLTRGTIDVRAEPHHPGVYGKRTLRETVAAWGEWGSHSGWGVMAGKEQVRSANPSCP